MISQQNFPILIFKLSTSRALDSLIVYSKTLLISSPMFLTPWFKFCWLFKTPRLTLIIKTPSFCLSFLGSLILVVILAKTTVFPNLTSTPFLSLLNNIESFLYSKIDLLSYLNPYCIILRMTSFFYSEIIMIIIMIY